jgi:hypothetical protein
MAARSDIRGKTYPEIPGPKGGFAALCTYHVLKPLRIYRHIIFSSAHSSPTKKAKSSNAWRRRARGIHSGYSDQLSNCLGRAHIIGLPSSRTLLAVLQWFSDQDAMPVRPILPVPSYCKSPDPDFSPMHHGVCICTLPGVSLRQSDVLEPDCSRIPIRCYQRDGHMEQEGFPLHPHAYFGS